MLNPRFDLSLLVLTPRLCILLFIYCSILLFHHFGFVMCIPGFQEEKKEIYFISLFSKNLAPFFVLMIKICKKKN